MEQLYALKDKTSCQNNDFLQSAPMSQHGEQENALMAENGLSRLNCSAQSWSKDARIGTSRCLVVDSLTDTEDDIALSKSSSTSGVATHRKNIYNSDCENEDEASTWSSILEEANQLVCSHENTTHSLFSNAQTETGRSHKGYREKVKPKFSIRLQTHKKECYFHSVVKTENEESSVAEDGPSVHKIQHIISANSMAELLEELQQETRELQEPNDTSAKVVSLGKRDPRYPMSTLLEDLGKNSSLKWPSKLVRKNAKVQIVGRRTTSHLGSRSLDDEDAPEPVGSGTSSEDEANDINNLIPATTNIKGQTMADIFQEIFSVSNADLEEIPLATRVGIGYHGRLQQIMQRDKDRHMGFLKQLYSNESKGINVKILSRALDAKLTVCCCLLSDKAMISQTGNSPKNYEEIGETTVKTVIFSSKICTNVDLEVGNFICMYPPWKEIKIRDDDTVILCAYFSQLMS